MSHSGQKSRCQKTRYQFQGGTRSFLVITTELATEICFPGGNGSVRGWTLWYTIESKRKWSPRGRSYLCWAPSSVSTIPRHHSQISDVSSSSSIEHAPKGMEYWQQWRLRGKDKMGGVVMWKLACQSSQELKDAWRGRSEGGGLPKVFPVCPWK